MPTLIDKTGNRFDYTTLTEHNDSLSLDGDRFIHGKLFDFTIEDGHLQPVITFAYPISSAKATNITIDLSVINPADNTTIPVTETYYVPLINLISGAMDQILVVPVVNGVGQVIFSVTNAGIYGIRTDLIRPKPTASFSEIPDIVIY